MRGVVHARAEARSRLEDGWQWGAVRLLPCREALLDLVEGPLGGCEQRLVHTSVGKMSVAAAAVRLGVENLPGITGPFKCSTPRVEDRLSGNVSRR